MGEGQPRSTRRCSRSDEYGQIRQDRVKGDITLKGFFTYIANGISFIVKYISDRSKLFVLLSSYWVIRYIVRPSEPGLIDGWIDYALLKTAEFRVRRSKQHDVMKSFCGCWLVLVGTDEQRIVPLLAQCPLRRKNIRSRSSMLHFRIQTYSSTLIQLPTPILVITHTVRIDIRR